MGILSPLEGVHNQKRGIVKLKIITFYKNKWKERNHVFRLNKDVPIAKH